MRQQWWNLSIITNFNGQLTETLVYNITDTKFNTICSRYIDNQILGMCSHTCSKKSSTNEVILGGFYNLLIQMAQICPSGELIKSASSFIPALWSIRATVLSHRFKRDRTDKHATEQRSIMIHSDVWRWRLNQMILEKCGEPLQQPWQCTTVNEQTERYH